ncbi:MAG: hypothetical protein JRE23_17355 [Deltaproteobacteria bacterium]|nr:hypothetical protein [Deltaproteobacteria bacterium]
MAGKKKTNKTKPIDSLKHKDKRANIPTEELNVIQFYFFSNYLSGIII